jgi:hypothetical protein
MSTGLECVFYEIEAKGEHFYILQNWDCPKGAYNWMEYAKAYGPFKSFDAADQHLSDNHANPGGFWRRKYTEGSSETVDRLLAEARQRPTERPSSGYYFSAGGGYAGPFWNPFAGR